jgi:hypothetical protein
MNSSVQPEVGFVAVNGTELYYETLGDGPPGPNPRRLYGPENVGRPVPRLRRALPRYSL